MMSRSPDIMFMAEYIKNVLYFATVREGKTLKSSGEIHYFSIDNELIYENYYSDFGPLNLGCVYKYCKILNDKLKQYLNKQKIVHYTSLDPKKKANAAFLLGCYGVLYLSLQPRDALKPLLVHGQSYRPFQDATQGDSGFTISLMDCLNAMTKAKDLGFFNFQDFNYEEYNRLDKIQGGDLNWIVPGKFLAFIGPVDYSVSLYHPPEMYIDYFLENNVKIVIRLNKRLYDGNVFSNAGINHYDLFFPDGSCPPRHILMKFLQISEESDSAIAVHCKAGLGRTGSLIGCYLIKHYRMTSHEAIGWMRICRPGSVIGHQQAWLEQLEAWLIKQGDLYRRRSYNDPGKLPYHEFGVYSIAEKTLMQQPVVFHKSLSPTPTSRPVHSDVANPVRAQASKAKEDKKDEEDEIFITSCDLTVHPTVPTMQLKGCVIKNNVVYDENMRDSDRCFPQTKHKSFWKRVFSCDSCVETLKDGIWAISVRCASIFPKKCNTNRFCVCLDRVLMVATNKTKAEPLDQWRLKQTRVTSPKVSKGRDQIDAGSNVTRRGSGGGEPRPPSVRSPIKHSAKSPIPPPPAQRSNAKLHDSGNHIPRNLAVAYTPPITTFRTTNGPVIKNVTDARNYLLKSSMYNEEREKQLLSAVTVTHRSYALNRPVNHTSVGHASPPPNVPMAFTSATRNQAAPSQRRRLGRSPSPMQSRCQMEQTRATNTPPPSHQPGHAKVQMKRDSKAALREALSRLKLTSPREGSIGTASVGAASLGARRDAPIPKRAPSVRSDERPLATQGDLLNSIKFQRRLRDTMLKDKMHDKPGNPITSKDKIRPNMTRGNQDYNSRDKPGSASKNFFGPTRPSSPKGRRSPHTFY